MRQGAEAGEDFAELVVGEKERVTAGEEDVADFSVRGEVFVDRLEVGLEFLLAHSADHAAARAVAAVAGASVGDEEEDAVGITVYESGHGHVRVLAAGVGHFAGGDDGFAGARDDLAADRAVGVVRLDEVEVVRRDGEGQLVAGEEEPFTFVGGQAEMLLGLFE